MYFLEFTLGQATAGIELSASAIICLTSLATRRCGSFDLPIAKSSVSHHFKVLRDSGLIRVEAQGNTRTATLRRDDIEARFPGLLAVTGILGTGQAAANLRNRDAR